MPRIDRRLLALVVGGVFLLAVATLPGHLYSVDGLGYYRTATTLAWDGSLILDPPLVWGSLAAAGLALIALAVRRVSEHPYQKPTPPPAALH